LLVAAVAGQIMRGAVALVVIAQAQAHQEAAHLLNQNLD
jgi:hypothetical protein